MEREITGYSCGQCDFVSFDRYELRSHFARTGHKERSILQLFKELVKELGPWLLGGGFVILFLTTDLGIIVWVLWIYLFVASLIWRVISPIFKLFKHLWLGQSIKRHDGVIRRNSLDAYVYHKRGSTYAQLGRHQRAIEDFDEAIRLDPQSAAAHSDRALAYTRLGDASRAQPDVERAVELGSDRASLEARIERSIEKEADKTNGKGDRQGFPWGLVFWIALFLLLALAFFLFLLLAGDSIIR